MYCRMFFPVMIALWNIERVQILSISYVQNYFDFVTNRRTRFLDLDVLYNVFVCWWSHCGTCSIETLLRLVYSQEIKDLSQTIKMFICTISIADSSNVYFQKENSLINWVWDIILLQHIISPKFLVFCINCMICTERINGRNCQRFRVIWIAAFWEMDFIENCPTGIHLVPTF